MTPFTRVLAVVAALVVAAGIAIGGWQLHWWLQQSAQGHINHIQRYTYGFQAAQLQDATNAYEQIASLDTQIAEQPQNAGPLQAQKAALETQFCEDYQTLVTISIPQPIKAFATAACHPAVQP